MNILLEPAPPLRCPINTSIINTIDNNQKVGKCERRIKEGSKIPISIHKTVGHIETKPAADLQDNPQLSPENWLNKLSSNNILEKVNTLESNSLSIFRLYRGKCITSIIDEIKQEQIFDEFSYCIRDYIDIAVQNASKSYMWSKCSAVFNKTLSKCPKCLFDSLNHELNYNLYQRTSSQHPTEKPEIHVGEPCMVNPCSQESVYNVMKHTQNI